LEIRLRPDSPREPGRITGPGQYPETPPTVGMCRHVSESAGVDPGVEDEISPSDTPSGGADSCSGLEATTGFEPVITVSRETVARRRFTRELVAPDRPLSGAVGVGLGVDQSGGRSGSFRGPLPPECWSHPPNQFAEWSSLISDRCRGLVRWLISGSIGSAFVGAHYPRSGGFYPHIRG